MSTIGGTASNNEMQHKSFLTPATRNNAILDYGGVASDVVEIEGGTADEAFQNLLDVVAAPSPNNPFNTGDTNQSPSSTVNLLNGLKVYKLTSTAGHVLQAEITNVGTGYSVGGSGVSTSGGAGTGCQVQVISVGTSAHAGKVLGVKITANGSGYSDGDVLTISGGGGNATITIKTVAYFRTLLYVQESHGVSSITSTVAELKAQGLAYTGSDVTSVSNGETDYSNIGVTLPNIFDEPLTVVSKPTATSHRVIVGQARNPTQPLQEGDNRAEEVSPIRLVFFRASTVSSILQLTSCVKTPTTHLRSVNKSRFLPTSEEPHQTTLRSFLSDTFWTRTTSSCSPISKQRQTQTSTNLRSRHFCHQRQTDSSWDLGLRTETQQAQTNLRLLSLSILSTCRFSVRNTQTEVRLSSLHM